MEKIKMEYHEIINDYHKNEIQLESEIMYILEAENIDPDINKNEVAKNAQNTMSKIIDKIIKIVDDILLKLKNRVRMFITTNKGFQSSFQKAERDRKPLNGVKLITFLYSPELLTSQYGRFKNVVAELIKGVDSTQINKDDPLLLDKDELLNYIFDKLGYKGEKNTVAGYLTYIKKGFRGTKTDTTIMASQIPEHKKNVNSYQSTYNLLNKELVTVKGSINNLKSKINRVASNSNTSNENKNEYRKKITGLSLIFSFYSSFISTYYELILEEMLTSRAILKRLYQL